MIPVNKLFEAVSAQANTEESGLIEPVFNSFLYLAEIDLLDWLTGKLETPQNPPAPFITQKNKDWLQPFLVTEKGNFSEDWILVPANYYYHQSLRTQWQEDCDNGVYKWIDVPVLHSNKVKARLDSTIEGVKPTNKNPISEMVNSTFKLYPEMKGGTYEFVYIRKPVFAEYNTIEDEVWRTQVYDPTRSKNLEWPESAVSYFVFRINHYINKRHTSKDQYAMNMPQPNEK